ncbi:hypothetical protein GCM10028791_33480 [Echinicola sediminis]
MKRISLLLLLLMAMHYGHGQTFKEWFRQKKTAKEYLAKQVVGLQLYIGHAKKGYETLRWGWNAVQQVREGEFGLHEGFFQGLERISPGVSKYETVPRFIDLQSRLVRTIGTSRQLFIAHGRIRANERQYLDKVFEKALSTASDLLDELMAVALEPGLELSDAERLAIIDDAYARLQELNSFVQAFNRENYRLLRQRAWEAQDHAVIHSLYNLKTP